MKRERNPSTSWFLPALILLGGGIFLWRKMQEEKSSSLPSQKSPPQEPEEEPAGTLEEPQEPQEPPAGEGAPMEGEPVPEDESKPSDEGPGTVGPVSGGDESGERGPVSLSPGELPEPPAPAGQAALGGGLGGLGEGVVKEPGIVGQATLRESDCAILSVGGILRESAKTEAGLRIERGDLQVVGALRQWILGNPWRFARRALATALRVPESHKCIAQYPWPDRYAADVPPPAFTDDGFAWVSDIVWDWWPNRPKASMPTSYQELVDDLLRSVGSAYLKRSGIPAPDTTPWSGYASPFAGKLASLGYGGGLLEGDRAMSVMEVVTRFLHDATNIFEVMSGEENPNIYILHLAQNDGNNPTFLAILDFAVEYFRVAEWWQTAARAAKEKTK